jgi:xylulokinase
VVQATGTGLVHEGVLGITIGTGGIVSTALESCRPNPEGKLQVFCMNSAGTWHAMGVSLTVGGALKWLKDACGYGQSEASRLAGEDVYDSICREAETVEPGSEGLLFLPHLVGSRCPFDDAKARGAFVGFTLRHERRHMFRALMESCVMSLRDIAEIFAAMGIPWRQLRTSGGASKGRLWRQLQADAFDTDVVTVSGASHGGAYGAALIAGSGTGAWRSLKEAAEVLEVQTHETPIARNVERYGRLLSIYQGLYPALRETFHRIADEYLTKGE